MRLMSLLAIVLTCGVAAPAADALPDPDRYLEKVMANPNLRKTSGEAFCWHAASAAEDFLDAYEASRDPAWLDAGRRFYAYCVETNVSDDPDGFPGTIGGPFGPDNAPGKAALVADTVVGDGLFGEFLARWCELVLADAALEARYGDQARAWVDLVTRMCWEKWNARGCVYRDRQGFVSYRTHEKQIRRSDWSWVDRDGVISDNLNKHYTIGKTILRLWRITGKDEYKERVKAIFGRHKHLRRHIPDEDRVVWNFWMPHGPYDMRGSSPTSWVAVHPDRAGYQAGEVEDFVEVYDSGLVFDRRDIELMAATNRWMAERGWRSADGSSKAGTLWGALARFDATIGAEFEKRLSGDGDAKRIHRAYWERVLRPSGWQRRHVADEAAIEVVDVPLQPGTKLKMAMAIPDVVETANDDRIRLACGVTAPGTLTIELLDADGARVLGTLATETVRPEDNFFAPLWDGTNPATGRKDHGRFVLRWTLAGESRTCPVWVEEGVRRERDDRLAALSPGERLTSDFEGELDARWRLGGNVVGDAHAHGGVRCLVLAKDGAELVFGRHDDLPVRISFRFRDGGARKGKGNGNGAGWGLRNALGDVVAIRETWRPYLNGDAEYAWFNTGENRWFTPHRLLVARKDGWRHWEIDLGGDRAVIRCDGETVPDKAWSPPQFAPGRAVALVFFGGEGAAVDDVIVEYPAQ